MTTVRCYVPVDAAQLVSLRDDRTITGPLPATTVTEALRAEEPGADTDELEYAAAQVAAVRLAASGAPVLLAAVDVDAERITTAPDAGAWIEVSSVGLPRVAALHLGDDVVTGDRAQVTDALDQGVELSWFDTTELEHVLELTERLERTETTG
ncbi:MAG: hypothetical protein DI571_00220 [Arsenicicoccus sp.]|uniref:DUF6912 family protein n=1 Tax=Serinicoccus profundi TaxID=1078471 RepID=UPI000255EB3C|nr:hypothetical protein [Serinicoccus profundi]PZU50928.1 MAG: hypothetical protein DI571_00220 [Arsenicicoccus sp.]